MTSGTTDECLGLHVWIWCLGCDYQHAPTFKCPDHGGPVEGPTWEGNPYSDPFSMEPSLLVNDLEPPNPLHPRCHSFIRNGVWEFLGDCEHQLANHFVPMVPLPDWLTRT